MLIIEAVGIVTTLISMGLLVCLMMTKTSNPVQGCGAILGFIGLILLTPPAIVITVYIVLSS